MAAGYLCAGQTGKTNTSNHYTISPKSQANPFPINATYYPGKPSILQLQELHNQGNASVTKRRRTGCNAVKKKWAVEVTE